MGAGEHHVEPELAEALRELPLFERLRADSLLAVALACSPVEVRAGEVLIREGDPGDALFVVRSGLLEVVAAERRVRLLRAGASFGELALLSGRPRVATVRSVRDSRVWRLPSASFEALLDTDAGLAHGMIHALTRLVLESDARTPPGDSTEVYAVVGLHRGAPVDLVVDGFAATIGRDRLRICRRDDAGEPVQWAEAADRAEQAGHALVLVAGDERDEWFEFCVREADRVAAVAEAKTVFERIGATAAPDLVLFGVARPGSTGRSLAAGPVRAHHHVGPTPAGDDVGRAVRRIARRSVGVVLSGGGARGFAHVGVLRALADASLTVDRFGGTSMGALVGALAAASHRPGEVREILREELVQRKPFSDYGIPRVALIRARRAEAMLRRMFGEQCVEELPHDFFSVSADLVSAAPVVHRRGPVGLAVGASMSLPGLAPPVHDEGRILVDGGVLDNLPVEVMTGRDEGPVIAVDVIGKGAPDAKRRRRGGGTTPSILETIARSATLASRRLAETQRALAQCSLAPDLTGIGLLDFSSFDAAIAAGRRACEEALAAGTLPVIGR